MKKILLITSIFFCAWITANEASAKGSKVQRGVGTISINDRGFFQFTPQDNDVDLRKVKLHTQTIKYTDEIKAFFNKAVEEELLVELEIVYGDKGLGKKGAKRQPTSIATQVISYRVVASVAEASDPYLKDYTESDKASTESGQDA